MKGLLRIIIVLAVIIGLLVIARNFVIKLAVEKGVKAATGLSLEVEKFDIGLTTTHLGITGLSLLNPEGFSDRVMFYAPEIFVDYNLGAMIKGKVHLEEVRLDLDRFVIVRNAQGKLNLEALKPETRAKEKQEQAGKPGAKEEKPLDVQIDHLVLKVGKVIYKDYSQGGEPVIKEYNANISEEIHNVTDPKALLNFIVNKVLMKTALTSLIDLDVNLEDFSSQAVDTLADTLKEKMEGLTEKIKLPF